MGQKVHVSAMSRQLRGHIQSIHARVFNKIEADGQLILYICTCRFFSNGSGMLLVLFYRDCYLYFVTLQKIIFFNPLVLTLNILLILH